MPRRAFGLVLAFALIAAGCASAARPVATTTAPAASATPLAAPSAAPSTQPSRQPSAPASEVVTALPEGGNTVFPGRYTTHFDPALILTIDRQVDIDCAPGYRCRGDVDVNSANWLDLEFGHDHPVEINVMGFEQVYDPKHSGTVMDPPADLASWISAFAGVTVLAQKPVEIGGVVATQLDMRTSRDVPFGPTGLADLPSLGFGAHQLHRVVVARVAGAAVVIGLGSINPEDATPERLAVANEVLQPIVDSITWQ
jgi:hypothetical protein